MSKLFASAAVGAILLAASAAAAQGANVTSGPGGSPQIRVSVADLDLAKPAAAAVLAGRLRAAAAAVCGPRPAPLDLEGWQDFDRCRHESLNAAVAQLPGRVDLADLRTAR